MIINNVVRSPPYSDAKQGINVFMSGGSLKFTTNFGLSITWGGKSKAEILLDSAYGSFVCGLCGNGDGNKLNDFVDRSNNNVALGTERFTKYFEWGSKWRIAPTEFPINDASIDLDKTKCAALPTPCKDCIQGPV